MQIKLSFIGIATGFLFLPFTIALAQNTPNEAQHSQRLQNIRNELQKLRQQLEHEKKAEQSALDQLAEIDQESDLVRKLLRQLKTQESSLRIEILQANEERAKLLDELEIQKDIYAQRLVHFYKHKNLGDIEILLAAKSLNQAVIWLKYSRQIARTDQRRLQNLLDTQEKLVKANDRRRTKLASLEALVMEKSREENNLFGRKKEKEDLLEKNRDNQNYIAQKIKDNEKAQQELKRLIRESEFTRLNTPINLAKPSQFLSLKGKMIWPVKGKIINPFGKIKNPQMPNLEYINEGIDIQATFGDKVQAICPGVITLITWMRGLGNVVIINHYEGFHTIYAHLSEVDVSIGQEISAGTVIGLVGDSGSIAGPMLHFEVRQKTEPVNPLNWLTKNPA